MKKRKAIDRHHLYPKSTHPSLSSASWNVRLINKNRHKAWHLLVENQTPLQAIISLFREFVPNNLDYDPHYEELKELLKEL
jgi:hypothetical protein